MKDTAEPNYALQFLMDQAQALDEKLAKVEREKKNIERQLTDVTNAVLALRTWKAEDYDLDLLNQPPDPR